MGLVGSLREDLTLYWGGLLLSGQPKPGAVGHRPAPPHLQPHTGEKTQRVILGPLRGEVEKISMLTQKQVASHPLGQRRPSNSAGPPHPPSLLAVKDFFVSEGLHSFAGLIIN